MDNCFPSIVKSYSNSNVIYSFTRTFSIQKDEAEIIFNETKKWLWLCSELKKDRLNGLSALPERLFIHQPLLVLDEMWHTFILCTQDYKFFCDNCIGYFIHHFPAKEKSPKLTEDQIALQLSYIYDKLGEDTLVLWYKTISTKYTQEKLKEIRL